MSKLLTENKQTMAHIFSEIIVIVGLTFYFHQKNKKLLAHIEDLAQRVEEQEDLLQKHDLIIKKFVGYISNKLAKIAYLLATKVISYGPIMKKQLINGGISAKKIVITPQFTNFKRFRPIENKGEYKSNIGIFQEKKVALFIGRLTYLKGTDTLYSNAV